MRDSTMLEAWVFASENAAQRTSHRFGRRTGASLTIDDAGVVSWPLDRARPVAWQARDIAVAPLSGAFWGLMFASLFLLPISMQSTTKLVHEDPDRGPGEHVAGDVGLNGIGLDSGFLTAVRSSVVPGTSAIFLLFSSEVSDEVAIAMFAAGSCVARLELSGAQRLQLRAGFDD